MDIFMSNKLDRLRQLILAASCC